MNKTFGAKYRKIIKLDFFRKNKICCNSQVTHAGVRLDTVSHNNCRFNGHWPVVTRSACRWHSGRRLAAARPRVSQRAIARAMRRAVRRLEWPFPLSFFFGSFCVFFCFIIFFNSNIFFSEIICEN